MTFAEYDARWRLTEDEEEEWRSIGGRRTFRTELRSAGELEVVLSGDAGVSQGVGRAAAKYLYYMEISI